MKKSKKSVPVLPLESDFTSFLRRAGAWAAGLGVMGVCFSFYIRTYDSAAVKNAFLLCAFMVIFALWAAFESSVKNHINKQTLFYVLPFLVFCAWTKFSFLLNPHKAVSFESFFKQFIFFSLPALLALLLTKKNLEIINKCLLITASVCFIYGAAQIVDVYWLHGFDFMPWRAFFAPRIFSTLANPNFFGNFIIVMLFVVLGNYLKTLEKKYLALFSLGLVDLYFCGSKGAWVGFAAASLAFVSLYSIFFAGIKSKLSNKIIISIFALFTIVAITLAAVFTYKRAMSADFRLTTWRGVLEMVVEKPVLGHGSGSFASVYPQYKQTEIFYMEPVHNVQTEHAENEFLEVLSTNGLIGLALFIWLLWRVFKLALSKLKAGQDFMLLGFTCALAATLTHNLFDISMRASSGGMLFAVLCAMILVLCKEDAPLEAREDMPAGAGLKVLKILIGGMLIFTFATLLYDFNVFAGNTAENADFGRTVLRLVSWFVMLSVCISAGYLLFKILKNSKSYIALLCAALCAPAFWMADRYLLSDYYTNVAYFFVKQGDWTSALDNYTKALRANPLNTALYHSRASIFLNRFDAFPSYQTKMGDKNNVARNDFERARGDYALALKYNPREPLLRQHIGELYFKKGFELYKGMHTNADFKEILKYLDLAQREFELALAADPVNAEGYIRLSNIESIRGDNAKALHWLNLYQAGPTSVKNKEYLLQHTQNSKVNVLKTQLQK